jgi:hypothetical protein
VLKRDEKGKKGGRMLKTIIFLSGHEWQQFIIYFYVSGYDSYGVVPSFSTQQGLNSLG